MNHNDPNALADGQMQDYIRRNQERHLNDFPTKDELIKRIDECKVEGMKCHNAGNEKLAQAQKEKHKLPKLADGIKKAEHKYQLQRAVIEKLVNEAERIRQIESNIGQRQAEYEAQLINKDYQRRNVNG